jgi:hypothetical protein
MFVVDTVSREAGWNVSGQLLLGSIAPDAVQLRQGADGLDMNRTHLRVPDWKTAYRRAAELGRGNRGNPFLLGCAIHVMTDVLWRYGPRREAVRRYAEEYADVPDALREPFRIIYAGDCNTAERALFRTGPGERMWRAALSTPARDYADLVNANEVDRWRRERFAELQIARDPRASRLVTLPGVQKFIGEAGARIAAALAGAE